MNERYKTKGIVIAKKDFREADQLFSVFSEDFGKIDILGRSIRKIKSKLRQGIDIFYFSQIEFVQGKVYKTLTDAAPIEKYKNIKKDLEKLKAGYLISEVADVLIGGQQKDDQIFELLKESLGRLNDDSLANKNYILVYYYFFWNLASYLGYETDLYNCSFCHKKLEPADLYICKDNREILCSNCAKTSIKKSEISCQAVKAVRLLLQSDWRIISRLKISEDEMKSLEKMSNNYFSFIRSECCF